MCGVQRKAVAKCTISAKGDSASRLENQCIPLLYARKGEEKEGKGVRGWGGGGVLRQMHMYNDFAILRF